MPKLLNKTNLPNYASAPSSPANGDIYYNTTDHIVYARVNGAWVDLGASGGGSGDITDVVAGNGLTGGASTGSATLNVGAGTGITVNADDVAIDTTVVARKTDKLSDFAATSSSELAGVISDETGSGALVFGTGPTLSQPVIDNPRLGYATTATSAGTLTLTNTSGYYQLFTGSTSGQIVQLPVASTMALGQSFLIANGSSAIVTVQSSGLNTVQSVIAGTVYLITCILTSGTTAASWQARFAGSSTAITGSGSPVLNTTPAISQPTISSRATFSDAIAITPTTITASGGSNNVLNTDGYIRVTGSTTHTLSLTGGASVGQWFWIRNDSTGAVTVNASGGGLVATLASGQAAEIICLTAAGTTAADWAVHFLGASTVTGTGAEVRASSPTLVTPNLGVATATSINSTTIPSSATLITAGDTGTVTSAMIADGAIVNADINASAAIDLSKLATDPLARANHTGTQTASTISDFDTQVRTSKVTDLTAPTSSFSMNSQKITSLGTPTADADAATKAYVDAATAGLNVHASVRAATTPAIGNINLSTQLENGDSLDEITLATGDRVLVKDQTTKSENGVYIVSSSGAASRATDYDSTPEVDAGDFIFVESGTVNGKTGWVQTNLVATVGTDNIEFTQFSGAGTYTAGTGITLTGNQFSVTANTYQPLDSELTALAGLTSAADKIPYFTGSGTASTTDLTSAARSILDDASTGDIRSTLGVGTGDSPQFTEVNVGHATDTTITRSSAGTIAVEGVDLVKSTDSRLTDSRTPTSHATSHKSGGTDAIKLNEFAAPDADVSLNSNKITNLATPTSSADAATKAYVDAVAEGLDIKASVRVATTADLASLSTLLTIDGITLNADDRVLVKNQTNAVNNGIYLAKSGSWERAADAAQNGELTPGTFVFVESGSANADSGWVMTSDGTITIGATAMSWTQFSGAGQIVAGTGITKSVNTLSVDTAVVATLTGTQTLDNKTLTAPKFANSGIIADPSGEPYIQFAQTANPTGYLKFTQGNGTTVFPSITTGASGGGEANDYTISIGNNPSEGFGTTRFAGYVQIRNNAALRLSNTANTFNVSIFAPSALSANYSLVLPTTDGNAAEYLKTDGSGVLSWGPAATVYYQTTQPTGGTYAAGDIWIDSDNNTTPNTNALSMSTKTASYTIASDLSDYPDKVIEMNVSSANTLSVPTDATANYPIGTQIHVFQLGTGQTTIQAVTSGTTTVVGTPGTKLRAQYSFATLIKRAANYWIVVGDTAA